jgi:hypothetical protein
LTVEPLNNVALPDTLESSNTSPLEAEAMPTAGVLAVAVPITDKAAAENTSIFRIKFSPGTGYSLI